MKNLTLVLCFLSLSAWAQGLKKVDYRNKEIPTEAPLSNSPELSEAQRAELMKQLEVIKKNKEAADKYLEELDKDE